MTNFFIFLTYFFISSKKKKEGRKISLYLQNICIYIGGRGDPQNPNFSYFLRHFPEYYVMEREGGWEKRHERCENYGKKPLSWVTLRPYPRNTITTAFLFQRESYLTITGQTPHVGKRTAIKNTCSDK